MHPLRPVMMMMMMGAVHIPTNGLLDDFLSRGLAPIQETLPEAQRTQKLTP